MALTGGGQGSLWLWTPSSSRLVATWHRPHRHLRRAQRDRLSWRLPPGGRWPPPCLRTSKGGSRLPGGRRRQKAVWRARPICSISPPCARITEGQPCILRGLDAPVPAITTCAGHGAEPLSAASPSRLNCPRALGIGGQSAWGQLGPPSPSSPWWGGACVHLGSAGGAGLPGEGAARARVGGKPSGSLHSVGSAWPRSCSWRTLSEKARGLWEETLAPPQGAHLGTASAELLWSFFAGPLLGKACLSSASASTSSRPQPHAPRAARPLCRHPRGRAGGLPSWDPAGRCWLRRRGAAGRDLKAAWARLVCMPPTVPCSHRTVGWRCRHDWPQLPAAGAPRPPPPVAVDMCRASSARTDRAFLWH